MFQKLLPNATSAALADASEVRDLAEQIARAMRRIHGGVWRVSVNHDTCFVVVSRDFSGAPAGRNPEGA